MMMKKKKKRQPIPMYPGSLRERINRRISDVFEGFLDSFCPCLLVSTTRKRKRSRFHQESIYLRILKSLLGFSAGIGFSLVLFMFLIYVIEVPLSTATAWGCISSFILSLGLAFSHNFRCVFFLMLPSLFAKRGRAALLAYTYILVFSGPVLNVTHNLGVLSESLSCQQAALRNRTIGALRSAFSPLLNHFDAIKKVLKAAVLFAELVKEAFWAFVELFKELIGAIKRVFRWLRQILDFCPKMMEIPEQECREYLNEKKIKCRKIMTILFFLCELVEAFANAVCPLLRVAQLACVKIEQFKENTLEPLLGRVRNFTQTVKDGFYVNITTHTYYNYTATHSQTFSEVGENIWREIKSRTSAITTVLHLGMIILSFSFLLVVVQALLYRRRYLSNDQFDNHYLTPQVMWIERHRASRDQETILPLSPKQSAKYIFPLSFWLSKIEKKEFFYATYTILCSAIQIGVYLFLDYFLYWLMDRIAFYGRTRIQAPVPYTLQLRVKGSGLLSNMIKDMVDSLAPLLEKVPVLDLSTCLPEPRPPDLIRRHVILLLLSICFLSGLARAYGLRLRPMICACYYPHRERLRAAYLYSHVLRTKGGFLEAIRNLVRLKRSNQKGRPKEHRTNIVDVLASKSKYFRWMLSLGGHRREYCTVCGHPRPSGSGQSETVPVAVTNPAAPEAQEVFTLCPNPGCGALYCGLCYPELDGTCLMCDQPFRYDVLDAFTDVQESADDSEDTDIVLTKEDYAYQHKRPTL